jgi:hypothetical protein
MNLDLAAVIYRSFMKTDPSGKIAAEYLEGLRKAGEDVESLCERLAADDASPPKPREARYDGKPAGPHGEQLGYPAFGIPGNVAASARRSHPEIRRQMLSGAERAEYLRMMDFREPGEIGVSRTREGYLQISAGCPGEYRAQEAAKRGVR